MIRRNNVGRKLLGLTIFTSEKILFNEKLCVKQNFILEFWIWKTYCILY